MKTEDSSRESVDRMDFEYDCFTCWAFCNTTLFSKLVAGSLILSPELQPTTQGADWLLLSVFWLSASVLTPVGALHHWLQI